MSDTALGVRMSKCGLAVEVESGDGSGETRVYTLTPEQAHRFAATMLICSQQAHANALLKEARNAD